MEDPDALSADIERHLTLACQQADVIIFVVDVRDGVVALDRHVADRLRHLDTQVILVANKAETRALRQQVGEFFALGFGEAVPVSAQEGLGRTDLPGGDGSLLKDSIKRLEELEVEWLLPGHMDIIRGKDAVKANFRHLEQYWFSYL